MRKFKNFLDKSHRYAPEVVHTLRNGYRPVEQANSYAPGKHPNSPIINEVTAVKLTTDTRDFRWYGCERAYINAELRMVIVGHHPNDEVRQEWEIVPKELQA